MRKTVKTVVHNEEFRSVSAGAVKASGCIYLVAVITVLILCERITMFSDIEMAFTLVGEHKGGECFCRFCLLILGELLIK